MARCILGVGLSVLGLVAATVRAEDVAERPSADSLDRHARVGATFDGLQHYFFSTQDSIYGGVNATFWKSCGQTGGLGGAADHFNCKCETNSAYCKNCIRWWMAVGTQSLITLNRATATMLPSSSSASAAAAAAPDPTLGATKSLIKSLRAHSPYTARAAPSWAYIDDYMWYILMWMDTYEWLGVDDDLDSAATTLELMDQWGLDHTCGGIQWMYPDVDPRKNAITTLEAVQSSARVAKALDARGQKARADAHRQRALDLIAFFDSVGLRGKDDLIHDNVTGTPHGKFHCCNATTAPVCEVRDTLTWSYNQGMYLGALVDLHALTGNVSYLTLGVRVLDATIKSLTKDPSGQGKLVLAEPVTEFHVESPKCDASNDPSAPGGGDLFSFKGVFMQQLPRYVLAAEAAGGGILPAELAARARKLVSDSADAAWAARAVPPFASSDICNEFPNLPKGGPPKFTWDWQPMPTAAASSSSSAPLVCLDGRTQAQALSLFVADFVLHK